MNKTDHYTSTIYKLGRAFLLVFLLGSLSGFAQEENLTFSVNGVIRHTTTKEKLVSAVVTLSENGSVVETLSSSKSGKICVQSRFRKNLYH